MFTTRRFDRRSSSIAALLLSLTLFLVSCGGSVTPTGVPTATIAPATPTTVAAAPTATSVPATPTALPATPVPAAPDTPSPSVASETAGAPTATVVPPPSATIAPPTATAAPPAATPLPSAGQPTRVKIPIIRVDAAVEYVGLTGDGAMDVPKDYSKTAWYEPGPRPGDQGNAAIAGHVDSKTGKAVFWDLGKLKPGDEVFIAGNDGTERRFVVTGVESYGRTTAPLQQIFGPSTDRRLNLITCDPDSGFDRTKGEYAGNIVVYTNYAP